MEKDLRNISFGSFNLLNLQLPEKKYRGSQYTKKEYEEKIIWSRDKLITMNADIIAFQELWSPKCLRRIFNIKAYSPTDYWQ